MADYKIDYSKVYRDPTTKEYRMQLGAEPHWRDPTLTKHQVKQYRIHTGIKSTRITSIGSNQKYFTKGTAFTDRAGHLNKWSRPMSLKGGANPNYNWTRTKYWGGYKMVETTNAKMYPPKKEGGKSYKPTYKLYRVIEKQRWGAEVNSSKKSNSRNTFTSSQWIRHLQIAHYQLFIQAESFRIMVGKRALKVFQNSFREQKFYSNKGRRWPSLASYTLRKRTSRGTGSRILREYGDLINSIKIEERASFNKTRVYTDVVPANAEHHKKRSICYAGYHNEGKGKYGAPRKGYIPRPYKKRKFMGHSSHLNPITDHWLRKMMKQYLLDSVFLVRTSIKTL